MYLFHQGLFVRISVKFLIATVAKKTALRKAICIVAFMESEMVQNSTSNFSIIFNKHDQIQDNNFIKIKKCDLIQPTKFSQFQQN